MVRGMWYQQHQKRADIGGVDLMNKIAQLNDEFRTSLRGGRVLMTAGVQACGPDVIAVAVTRTREFTEFDGDNDPHGEHDFGSFQIVGHKFFWKIDYYDRSMEFGSEDPADPAKTMRVLTIMLASEY
jgi:hypothetical protein